MKQILIGLAIGTLAGIIDVIPMVLLKLPWDANLSAFSMWVVIGLFLSYFKSGFKPILKGLMISFMVLIPNLFIIGWKELISLIPILISTTILGSLSGYFYEKIVNIKKIQ